MITIKIPMAKYSELHTALPHKADLRTPEGTVTTVEVSSFFKDAEGKPKPIRASVDERPLGIIKVQTEDGHCDLPLVEMHITGLEDEAWVRSQLELIQQTSPENNHIVIVSRIAYAALREAGLQATVTPTNPVGFAIPGDIQRNGNEILHAARLDQPKTVELPTWDQNFVDQRLEALLQPLEGRRLHNASPMALQLANNFYLPPDLVVTPHYDEPATVVGYATNEQDPGSEIAIVAPRLNHLQRRHVVGDMDIQIVHPDLPCAVRSLGDTAFAANQIMTKLERDTTTGNLGAVVKSLVVYSGPTRDLIATHAMTS